MPSALRAASRRTQSCSRTSRQTASGMPRSRAKYDGSKSRSRRRRKHSNTSSSSYVAMCSERNRRASSSGAGSLKSPPVAPRRAESVQELAFLACFWFVLQLFAHPSRAPSVVKSTCFKRRHCGGGSRLKIGPRGDWTAGYSRALSRPVSAPTRLNRVQFARTERRISIQRRTVVDDEH